MTNRDIIADLNVLDDIAEMSFYEDAADYSDEELHSMVQDAEKQLLKQKNVTLAGTSKSDEKPTTSRKASAQNMETLGQVPKTSSSDNSSIEKLSPRSRRGTQSSKRRRNKGDAKSDESTNSHNSNEMPGWRVVNHMDTYAYPMLFQIEKTVQTMQTQLRDIEFNNSLQLRLMQKMVKSVIASRRQERLSSNLPFGVWILMFVWPLLLQFVYYWYKRNRHNLMLAFMDYM
ncbi:unnamed protein product [Bursaphelenchus xylophilus]|uniref:(pine wood nematode) hypothetical protein n=1 Tax=Bursaphelenchus xylophilus TaxID=6326 RepID=A0A1I7RZT4_BURXY|nr:unnamed protein product [Bursaphelenchus xylophilus]CAG9109254.1 unnamed protein product [Bursaphelenchus xylophilus]